MDKTRKHDVRKVKPRVANLPTRANGSWSDEEVQPDDWARNGLLVEKEMQRESWDCGLTCVQMVLGTLGDTRPPQQELAAHVVGTSVWSIDLAYLLSEYGVEAEYLTTASTVNVAKYSSERFYAEFIEKLEKEHPNYAPIAQNLHLLLQIFII